MRSLYLSILVAASLALSACGITPLVNTASSAVVETVADVGMVKATQALNTAENAYAVAAYTTAAAVRSGVVPASFGPRISTINRKANEYLDKALAAKTSVDRLRQVGLLESLTGELNSIRGGR